MAMEINGSLPDYAVRKQNYSSYGTQSMAESGAAGVSAINGTKKKGTEKTQETAGNSKTKSTAEYANELSKLVPSVDFRVGNSFSTAKNGKTLTVNPKLLEKMQNDPETEKEMKELIKGVESAVNMLDSVNKASGWTVVYKHCYIDENGKFRSIAYLRNDFMLNMSDELREERKKNSEELLEKTKEKAAERKEELSETLEEKSTPNKAEQLLKEKMEASKDGRIYLYDTDLKTIMEAAEEEKEGGDHNKKPVQAGANLDLQV